MDAPRYRVPSELREAVGRLMRESDLTVGAIALTTGVSLGTIGKWNRAEGWRPLRVKRRNWDASPPRLVALGRLARRQPGPVPPPPGIAPAGPKPSVAEPSVAEPAASDLATLRAALRDHIGRQIAAFDAALLGEGAAVIDSARVLRDLGGLKRLLDDLTMDGSASEGEGDGSIPKPAALDLPALRAEIAQRYGGRRGERPDGGVPGEPAGAAPRGAGA